MQSIIAIIVVLGLLIVFHELGHFLVARLLGIGVRTFSFGFGPRLASFTRGKTQYRISAVPLGGYVQLVGEREDEEDTGEEFSERESFALRPAWQRMLVVASGPVFNFLLAWIIYWGLFWAHGQMELLPVIETVRDQSPAAEAGIEPGDRVVEIAGQDIDYWRELAGIIHESEGRPLDMTLARNGERFSVTVTPELSERKTIFGESVKTPLIGITASGKTVTVPMGPGQALVDGGRQTWAMISLTLEGFVKLIERIVPLDTVGGPIMIAQMVSEQAKQGWANVLALTAIISVNLGIINLLPIPVLDGGHIIFFGIEMVRRKPVSRRVQELTTKIGLIVLITIMALALYNDLARIFSSS